MITNKNLAFVIFFVLLIEFVEFIKSEEDLEDEIPLTGEDLDVTTVNYDQNGNPHIDMDYESLLETYRDTDDLNDLEPTEVKKRLGKLFDKMDDDKNGTVSKGELSEWTIKSLIKLDAEGSMRLFDEIDENHDKNITFNEYLTNSYGHTEKELKENLTKTNEWESFLKRINLDRERFNLADKNNNSLLHFEEFIKFNNPDNYIEMVPYTLNRTLTTMDTNHDGVLDLEEFIGDVNADNDSEIFETNVFKEHDKDNNGVLDKKEIIEWKTPGFEKTARIEAEHLFRKTDVNNDKQLSKQEVIDQHEQWIGSHATDYGSHMKQVQLHEEL